MVRFINTKWHKPARIAYCSKRTRLICASRDSVPQLKTIRCLAMDYHLKMDICDRERVWSTAE